MPLLPIRALIIPLGAALMILALAGQSVQTRTAAQHADCQIDSCAATVVR
jgi:hypothetical protein